jgi:hypothetical protein
MRGINTGGASQETQRSREATLGWRCSCNLKHETEVAAEPHSSRGTYARREVDLTDTMADAQIDALFRVGPLDLNAANSTSRLTGNSGRTIRKIPTRKGAQHAWALANEAAARRVLSNRGKPEYSRLLMPVLDVPAAASGCAQCGAWCSLLTFVVRACVLGATVLSSDVRVSGSRCNFGR